MQQFYKPIQQHTVLKKYMLHSVVKEGEITTQHWTDFVALPKHNTIRLPQDCCRDFSDTTTFAWNCNHSMMTSSNENNFRVTGHLCGEFTGPGAQHIVMASVHDEVIKWKNFPRYWPFVRGIHRSPVNSPHKGQRRWALMFSLICVWINGWVNNSDVGDLRRLGVHYDVTVMKKIFSGCFSAWYPQ